MRRVRFLLAGGLFLVALATLSLPLLVPVDAHGNQFLFSVVGILILASGYFLLAQTEGVRPVCRCQAKQNHP